MSEKSLFFIAIIPSNDVYGVIKGHQKIMSEQFDSHKSYGHIPHITLVPPFRIDVELEKDLINLIKDVKIEANKIKIKGFNHFKKHTIFIDMEFNEKLSELHTTLFDKLNSTNWFEKKLTYYQRFNPHITIGYKDLKSTFKEAWGYFENQKIEEEFTISSISILKYDGEKWGIIL